MPARDVREFLRVALLLFAIFGGNARQNYVCMIRISVHYRGDDHSSAISRGVLSNDNPPSIELTISSLSYVIGYLDGFVLWSYAESVNRNVGFSMPFQEYVMRNSSGGASCGSA